MSLTDSYCTPRWLCDRLPIVDGDPCSNPRSHVRVRSWCYSLEAGLDGLELHWPGSIFMNHPYSRPLPWMQKLICEHAEGRCNESIVLAKHDHSTVWWSVLTAGLHGWVVDLWMLRERAQFEPPPGVETSTNNFCSSVVHRRRPDAPPLQLQDVAQLWRQS